MSDNEESLEERLKKFRLWNEASAADGLVGGQQQSSAKPNVTEQEGMNRGGPSRRAPAHLKGAQIGMYYRNLHRKQQQSTDGESSGGGGNYRKLQRNKNQERAAYEANEGGSSAGRFRRFQDQRDLNLEDDRPPPGLKGRSLGLFFRDRQTAKKLQREKQNAVNITIPAAKIQEIRRELNLGSDGMGDVFREFVENENIRSVFKNEYLRVIGKTLEEVLKEESELSLKYGAVIRKQDRLDEQLYQDYQRNERMNPLRAFRDKLPIFASQFEVLDMIDRNQVILIKGETGSGKTTQVPQYILEQELEKKQASMCRILCTQPRRISAITLAQRVAEERGEQLGKTVGYQIRLEAERPRNNGGSIMFCTTGIVLTIMQSDPLLREYTHLILDEIHERDVITDLLLAIIKMVLPYRKDLKVILMSATLAASTFSQYFDNCPMVEIQGFTYPVQEHYLEDVLQTLKFYPFPPPGRQSFKGRDDDEFQQMIESYATEVQKRYSREVIRAISNPNSESVQDELIVELIYYITASKPDGAILVFLPSLAQISEIYKMIKDHHQLSRAALCVYPLHSKLPSADQRAVFVRPPTGTRKIILSTNIAETSITIDDIVYVINAGRHKLNMYENGVSCLRDEWISRSNEIQRKGRAGRVAAGVCYHLYTRARNRWMEENTPPEILRVVLDEVILQIKILRLGEVRRFMGHLLDAPDEKIIEESLQLLNRLNAIDDEQKLTPLGYHLARLPMDPRTGKMVLLSSIFGCADPITSIAASLTFKNAFYKPMGKEKEVDHIRKRFANGVSSDHIMLANVIDQWRNQSNSAGFCHRNFLNQATLRQLVNMKRQFCEYLCAARFLPEMNVEARENNQNSQNIELLSAIIGAGLYPNVAFVRKVIKKRNSPDGIAVLHVEGQGRASMHPSSVNSTRGVFHSNFVVYYDIQRLKSLMLFDTTVVNPFPLFFFGDNHVETENDYELISIAGHYCLKCDKDTYQLIQDLRNGFNLFLQKKICEPAPVNWHAQEGKLLRAIIQLITTDCKYEEYFGDANWADDDGFSNSGD